MVEKVDAGGRSIDAFEAEARGHRRSILTEREKESSFGFVEHNNAKGEPIDSQDVHANVVKHEEGYFRTNGLTHWSRGAKYSWKKTTQTLVSDGMFRVS